MLDVIVRDNQIVALPEAFLEAWGNTPSSAIYDSAEDADPARRYFLSAVGERLDEFGYATLNEAQAGDLALLLEPEPLPVVADWIDPYWVHEDEPELVGA